MKLSQAIRKALDHLKKDGWTKNSFGYIGHDGKHKHCIRGALVCVNPAVHLEACNAIMDTIQERTGVRMGVVGFNDGFYRTFDEVVEVMEKTAIRLEERGD